jgi:hypothetical protein
MSPDPGLLGRDARWMRSLGKSEGSEGRNVLVRVEPGGNEPIGANENSPDLMPLGPVGKAVVDVLQRQRPCVLDATVQTNKSCLEGAKNSQVTGGQHGDRIDSDAERQPLMTRKERIKRLVPLRRIDGRLGHHLTDQGDGKTPPRPMKARNLLDRLRQANSRSRAAAVIWFVGMINAPRRRETSTIFRTTGARST